jgi:hypothetical protein
MQGVIYQMYAVEEEEEELLVMAAAGALVWVDQEARNIRNERRALRHQSLLRSDLIKDPRGETTWQVLYRAQNPQSFVTTMGFDPIAFQSILDAGLRNLW